MATPIEVLEGNSCVFEVAFKDENDAGVTPLLLCGACSMSKVKCLRVLTQLK